MVGRGLRVGRGPACDPSPPDTAREREASHSAPFLFSPSQLPLMNQWKDEFKAHSRVKCPNSGCWLEFPSIYGLKYHYQRCQGVRRPEGCVSLLAANFSITACR